MRGRPARSSIDLKCSARRSALIGCPDGVLKTKSWPSGHKSCVLAFLCRSRRRATVQRCNLMGRRLRERFVSQKHHLPFTLRMLRTTLTVCRTQSMSCHFNPRYSLGRIPVVSATANTEPSGVARTALRNICACSTVGERISSLGCCGVLTPSLDSQAANATARLATSQILVPRVCSERSDSIVLVQSSADKWFECLAGALQQVLFRLGEVGCIAAACLHSPGRSSLEL